MEPTGGLPRPPRPPFTHSKYVTVKESIGGDLEELTPLNLCWLTGSFKDLMERKLYCMSDGKGEGLSQGKTNWVCAATRKFRLKLHCKPTNLWTYSYCCLESDDSCLVVYTVWLCVYEGKVCGDDAVLRRHFAAQARRRCADQTDDWTLHGTRSPVVHL